MQLGLIERRHPALGAMLGLWREGNLRPDDLPDALAAMCLHVRRDGGDWRIISGGSEIDALYGRSVAGLTAESLAGNGDTLVQEVEICWETGQPLLLEAQMNEACRVARLYLPVSDQPDDNSVLCGIVVCG